MAVIASSNAGMSLKKVILKSTSWVKDESEAEVLQADEPHALVMAAGYLKFNLAKNASEGVYFRGQRKLYGTLPPTLYRGLSSAGTQVKRHEAVARLIEKFRASGSIFDSFGSYAHEPLLQHYGISTTWIDLVDNLWVALWFACYKAMAVGKIGEYVHFERRIPSEVEKYAYILLVGADISHRAQAKPGYFFGKNTELVDLRMAAPSVFLRPHAQHGLLFRLKGGDGGREFDYSRQIRGVIRVELTKALSWLGSGTIVNTHSLFPPPYYDNGYHILLTCGIEGDKNTGTISHIGA